MPSRRRVRPLALLTTPTLLLGLAVTGCGSGDDATDSDGSRQSGTDSAGDVDQDLLASRTDAYQAYAVDEATSMLTATKQFTDAVRAGHVEAAKAAYADSRYHWETIEPLAGLVSDVDGAVDSRVGDFASVKDPAFTGWHRLEYILWQQGSIDGEAKQIATQLDQDLARLPELIDDLDMTPKDVALGAAGLIEEVSEGKLTGEEDRYSHTDLYDLAANVNGSFRAFQSYEPVLVEVDKPLEQKIEQGFLDAKSLLSDYQRADGSYESFLELSKHDKQQLQAVLATLSEDLSTVPGVLAL
jgi:iron uptake system component EfeO